ncbi:hypothetical protein KSF_083850 [Reticulibacter mediterranei]|uniref:Uncharacterized protein n=1 Tax=Reticulibacter mediterranei TaxID=2778369 RepID=A0A8J3IWY6_9CHLR|nr:hypothetical protein [Reticulibacter mediterranei]GHO98337.1 hypothetical protein KSF_083850 [Reticulibacter mediterranei]
MAWLPFLKEYAELFLLGAIFVAVLAVLALYRRRQLSRDRHSEEDLSQRKRGIDAEVVFMRENQQEVTGLTFKQNGRKMEAKRKKYA